MKDRGIHGRQIIRITELVWITCEYIWDHFLGEPDEPSTSQLFEHTKQVLQEWYKDTSREQRDQI